ncbi:MAG: PqqD family protein [Pyrinomonadaceae bacterium]
MVDATFSISRAGFLDHHPMTLNDSSTIVARRDLLCCDLSEGAVILDMQSGVYYGLDDVGTFVWGLIQEPKVLSDITAAVLEEYSVEPERCALDLKDLFSEMAQRNLINIQNEPNT